MHHGGVPRSQVIVPFDCTGRDLKRAAIAAAGLDTSAFDTLRIRVTDGWGSAGGLVRRGLVAALVCVSLLCVVTWAWGCLLVFRWHQMRDENLKMSKELKNGSMFLLEQGRAPRPGEVLYQHSDGWACGVKGYLPDSFCLYAIADHHCTQSVDPRAGAACPRACWLHPWLLTVQYTRIH